MHRDQIRNVIIIAIIFFVLGFFFRNLEFFPVVPPQKPLTPLEKIKAKHRLDVVILNSPTSYFVDSDGPAGYEYDLLKAYADHLEVDLNLSVIATVAQAIELSVDGVGDIASAAITKTPDRAIYLHFGPSYYQVKEQIICHKDRYKNGTFPKSVDDLKGLNLVVGNNTSYEETLRVMQYENPDLNFTVVEGFSTEQLLEAVWEKEIDCTVADSNIYSINLRYFPELAKAFDITQNRSLAWVLQDEDSDLKEDMYHWINEYTQSGKIAELNDQYYSYANFFDYYNTKLFYKRMKSRLPHYQKYFEAAGKKYDVPWTLLAAQSYQESYWNAKAVSPTGVRGLMMLTRKTAKILGVKNRRDPKQSIFGGALFLSDSLVRVPKDVKGENRLKYALAAYNVGMNHIKDAQILARRMGKNPNIWKDLKKILPLLSHRRYYRTLKYGYARGSEPVGYVDSIYDYRDILVKSIQREADKKAEMAKLKEAQKVKHDDNKSAVINLH